MAENWVKEFSECPGCGGESRMFEQMGREVKERGLAKEEMTFYYDMRSGPLATQDMLAKLPLGGEVPAFVVCTDICLDCGCIYAVKLESKKAKKGLAPVQLVTNRAQRRAGGREGLSFQLPS